MCNGREWEREGEERREEDKREGNGVFEVYSAWAAMQANIMQHITASMYSTWTVVI